MFYSKLYNWLFIQSGEKVYHQGILFDSNFEFVLWNLGWWLGCFSFIPKIPKTVLLVFIFCFLKFTNGDYMICETPSNRSQSATSIETQKTATFDLFLVRFSVILHLYFPRYQLGYKRKVNWKEGIGRHVGHTLNSFVRYKSSYPPKYTHN